MVTVDVGQAGERVVCQCGATIDVPPLRKLRHLPVAAPAVDRATSTWGARHGIVAACLILAAVAGLWALWSRLREPYVAPFDAEVRRQVVERGLEELTPAQAWQQWIEWFRPLAERGFSELEHPHQANIDRYVAKERFLQKTLLAIAGVFVAVAVVAALWPRAKTRRRGDETRRIQ
jgi:hypothetical protein